MRISQQIFPRYKPRNFEESVPLKIRKGKNAEMGILLKTDKTLYTLCFTDNQIELAQDDISLEYMARKLRQEYKKLRLKVNITKINTMCIGGEQQKGILIENVNKEHRYLVMKIRTARTLDDERMKK